MTARHCVRCGAELEGSPPTCPVCSHVHYLDPKTAACVIFRWEGGIFLLRRAIAPGYGRWTYPGGYVEVQGNRYSVPGSLTGTTVRVSIGLEGTLRVFSGETLVAHHQLQDASAGWVQVPLHHRQLWQAALGVQHRSLEAYEELL